MTELAVSIIAAAFFIQSVVGFGAGLISVPLLAFFLPPVEAVTLVLLFQFLNAFIIVFNRDRIKWDLLGRITPGVVIGSLAGLYVTTAAPENAIRIAIGVVILLYLARERFFPRIEPRLTRRLPPFAVGSVGGVIQGAFGTGGPVFVMYYKALLTDAYVLRTALLSTFFVSNAVRLGGSAVGGLITADILTIAAITLPFAMLAMMAGQRVHNYVRPESLKLWLDVLLLGSAVSLIAKAVI